MKHFVRFFVMGILCAGGAFGQQTFGQIVFGGAWQTTFTLINMSTVNAAIGTLSFVQDNGSPLIAPVQGSGSTSSYPFTIPAGGTLNVVLPSSADPTTQGWVNMTVSSGSVRGQGAFSFRVPSGNGTISEAAVPLSGLNSGCIICFPTTVILVPFDNTAGYVTSLALANITSSALSLPIEVDDQSGKVLVTDTLNLAAMNHVAFVTRDAAHGGYAALVNQKGLIRIQVGSTGGQPSPVIPNVTVLGLLTNPTGAISTILPVTQ